ncbi:MAG: DSD1 family PLP-dependent enzyme [Planctomycetaceae bacterium]
MTQSLIGTSKRELDTPILCIDLDVMESNIARMANFMAQRGKQWRPHAKCHKTPAIAHMQIAAGAIGVTCAKVSEAEVMAAAGIRDILIANMIVGPRKLERVVSLCRSADPIVACDHYAQVEPLSAICDKHGVSCRVIIEVNIGLDRVGIRPGRDTLDLALAIDKLPGVEFAGIMGYEGHLLQVVDQAEKRQKIAESVGILVECRDLILKNGLKCDIVSAGGTGSYQITSDSPGITELQAGGGIFADPMYRHKMHVDGLDYALTVLATVVSRPVIDKAILDSGRKTLNPDLHMPLVKRFAQNEAEAVRLSAEHCELKLSGAARDLKIGDKVELIVGYADFTTVLHDEFHGFRNDRLEVVWPILGRGKIQ